MSTPQENEERLKSDPRIFHTSMKHIEDRIYCFEGLIEHQELVAEVQRAGVEMTLEILQEELQLSGTNYRILL